MGRSRRSSTGSDSDYGPPIRITKTQVLPVARSHSGRHRHHSPDTVVVNANNYLTLPNQGQRARASSTSGQPAPVINNYYAEDRSRSHSRRRRPDSSSSSDYHRSRSRHRHRDDLPEDLLVDLAISKSEREKRRRDEAVKQALRDAKLKEQEEKEEHEKIVLEAKLKEEAEKRKAEEKEKEIVAAWQQKEREKEDKKKKEQKEFDEKYEERVKMEFLAAGYSEATIENIIKKRKDKEKSNRLAIDQARPTFIRVHSRYLSTITLDHYGLPWEWDRQDSDYIIIKKYISHDLQEDLFDHTKRLKNRKLIEAPKTRRLSGLGDTELRVDGSNMFVVKKKARSKSPARGFFVR